MSRRALFRLAVFLVLTGAPAVAQDRAAVLAAHLDAVPAAALALFDDTPDISFGDLAAAARVTVPPPDGALPIYGTPLGQADRAAIPGLADMIGLADDWPRTVGFALGDLRGWTELALPPERLTLIDIGATSPARITDALLARGYLHADRAFPAWFRGADDYAIDFAARDPADPFGGRLGQSSRVTFLGPLLMQSSGWALIDIAIAGSDSLADRPDIAALLSSLDALPPGDAALVTARLMLDPLRFGPAPAGPALPPWSAGLIADLSDGDTAITAIALSYATRDLAKSAATTLRARWTDVPLAQGGETLAIRSGTELEVAVTGDGPFVALAHATSPVALDGGRIVNPVDILLRRAAAMGDLSLLAP